MREKCILNIADSKRGKKYNLRPERTERLEEIGFIWHVYDAPFHKRYHELVAFKKVFGHCNVPRSYNGNPSLGLWCKAMGNSYSRKQKGSKCPSNLPQDIIDRLAEISFKWQIQDSSDDIFEKRYHELAAFKKGLDTAMFLEFIKAINHWDIGVDP